MKPSQQRAEPRLGENLPSAGHGLDAEGAVARLVLPVELLQRFPDPAGHARPRQAEQRTEPGFRQRAITADEQGLDTGGQRDTGHRLLAC
jgi:hypothetical protein